MSWPRLARDVNYLPGLAAVGLFVVLAVAFLNVPLGEPATFGGDAALTASIGAALLNIDATQVVAEGAAVPSEGFLVAFIVVAIVLDAALDGSLMLAKRDDAPDAVADGGSVDGSGDPARDRDGDEVTRDRNDGGQARSGGGDRSW